MSFKLIMAVEITAHVDKTKPKKKSLLPVTYDEEDVRRFKWYGFSEKELPEYIPSQGLETEIESGEIVNATNYPYGIDLIIKPI